MSKPVRADGQSVFTGVALVTVLAFAASACGGSLAANGSSDAAADGANLTDGSGDADPDAGLDGPYTPCASPDGLRVCGGPHHCAGDDNCHCIAADSGANHNDLTPCGETLGRFGGCTGATDGEVCIDWLGKAEFLASPTSAIELFALNDALDRVRYADMGLYTGDPIPEPSTCPTIPNVPLCGGACGGCPAGQFCHGRSRLHPYGLCFTQNPIAGCDPSSGVTCAGAGTGCFTFTVEPQAQTGADSNSLCMPLSQCRASAQQLPGGGKCGP